MVQWVGICFVCRRSLDPSPVERVLVYVMWGRSLLETALSGRVLRIPPVQFREEPWFSGRTCALCAEGPKFNLHHLHLKDQAVSDVESLLLRRWRAAAASH